MIDELDFLDGLKHLESEAIVPYNHFHDVVFLKSRWGTTPFVENWTGLSERTKGAFLDSLDFVEAGEISGFLADSVKVAQQPGDRELIIEKAVRFSGLHSLVPSLIAVHQAVPVNLQREIQWFLLKAGTGEALRFLDLLVKEAIATGVRQPAVAREIEARGFLASRSRDLRQQSQRFHGYYRPVDEWDLRAWLTQFEQGADQALMLQLVKHVRYFDPKAISKACAQLWSSVPLDIRADAYVTGLGPLAKSGNHILYEFRPSEEFDRKTRIADLPSILRNKHAHPLVILFLDDMIGSGHQAVRFYKALLDQENDSFKLTNGERESLLSARKYFLAITGYEDGIQYIKSQNIFDDVLVSVRLSEIDKAFSPRGPIYESLEDLRAAREIAEFYGNHLYPRPSEAPVGVGPGPLGYEDCEALVVFYYNTPNNTLPILWRDARVRRKDWLALFPRRE